MSRLARMLKLRTVVVLGGIILLGVFLKVPAPEAAHATTSCSGFQNLFTGADTGGNMYGAQASLNTRTPGLCGASWSDSSVWTMVAGANYCDYAQSGYGRHSGQSTVYYFAEYNYGDCSVNHDVQKVTTQASGTHSYTQQYNFNPGNISMRVDSNTLLTTSFDPAVRWLPPWDAQFFGEVHDNGDDIVGSAASPVYFSSIKVITGRSSGWVTPGTMYTYIDSSRYAQAWDTRYSKFHIWTR